MTRNQSLGTWQIPCACLSNFLSHFLLNMKSNMKEINRPEREVGTDKASEKNRRLLKSVNRELGTIVRSGKVHGMSRYY